MDMDLLLSFGLMWFYDLLIVQPLCLRWRLMIASPEFI